MKKGQEMIDLSLWIHKDDWVQKEAPVTMFFTPSTNKKGTAEAAQAYKGKRESWSGDR